MTDDTTDDAAAHERAAYIHIPFCRRRCPYCDFAVVDASEQRPETDRYVATLLDEIAMEDAWDPLHAVNFGGGTPSAMTPDQLDSLMRAVSNRFGLEIGAEVSIEANPEDWTPSYAESLREIGFNRVSLGVQSFDHDTLEALGRNHTPTEGAEAVAVAQTAAFDTVNVDLIFGTPGESIESWSTTVRIAIDLGIDHLSAYALTVERGTVLSRQVRAGASAPHPDDQADKYELLVEAAATAFRHYEVSNWAQPGKECRYNRTTWAQGEYLAFGLGAHSHRDGVRRRNVRRLDVYLERVEAGAQPRAGSEHLTEWEREKERVFLGVRRRSGVELGTAGAAFVGGDAGSRFIDAGIVRVEDGRLVVVDPLLTDAVAREVLSTEPDQRQPTDGPS